MNGEIALIRGRFLRDVRQFASDFLPPSVRASFTEPPSRLVTSANSDGGLPLDCQVSDSRGEEFRGVDQKYESLISPTTRSLTFPSQSTTRALLGRRNTSKSATSSWPLRTGRFGCTFYLSGRSLVLVGHPRFLSSPSRRLINWLSLRDLTLLIFDHPRIRIFNCRFKPSHSPSICRRQ